MPEVEERVDRLESLTAQTQLMLQSLSFEVSRTQINLNSLSREMKDFKSEMKDFKDEMKDFKDEMKDFKTHTQLSFDRMNKKWEKLVKKQGTLVEDMVDPNIKYIAEKYFNCKKFECNSFAIRVEKQHSKITGKTKEFDVIAVYPDKIVVNETKSNPRPELAVEFIDFIKNGDFFEYFPEYADKELIPVFASFHIPENVLKKLSKNKIYAMGIKEDTMDILNPDFLNSAEVRE